MNLLKLSKKQTYLFKAIIGLILIALSIYTFIEAYNSKDNFKLFMRVIWLILVTGYTINYVVLYLKHKP